MFFLHPASNFAQPFVIPLDEWPEMPWLAPGPDNSGEAGTIAVHFSSPAPVVSTVLVIRASRPLTETETPLLDLQESWLAGFCGNVGAVSLAPGGEEFEVFIPACGPVIAGSGRIALLGFPGGSGLSLADFEIVGGSVMVENVDILKQAMSEPRLEEVWQSGDQLRFRLAGPGTGRFKLFDLQGGFRASLRIAGQSQGFLPLQGIDSGIYFLEWDNPRCPGVNKVLILN
jgi:hypothetical protein